MKRPRIVRPGSWKNAGFLSSCQTLGNAKEINKGNKKTRTVHEAVRREHHPLSLCRRVSSDVFVTHDKCFS